MEHTHCVVGARLAGAEGHADEAGGITCIIRVGGGLAARDVREQQYPKNPGWKHDQVRAEMRARAILTMTARKTSCYMT